MIENLKKAVIQNEELYDLLWKLIIVLNGQPNISLSNWQSLEDESDFINLSNKNCKKKKDLAKNSISMMKNYVKIVAYVYYMGWSVFFFFAG